MCGITGFIDFKNKTSEQELRAMVNSLHHRGPDDSGVELFNLPEAAVGFGQARLSIIDLSNGGHQPMSYQHLSIVFNGEVYNYAEIKNELINCGHSFNTASDTEVILHAYYEWGQESVHKFTGMFAI